MKTVIIYFIICTTFTYCSSNSSGVITSPQQSISYKVNGVSRSFNAVDKFRITKGIPPIVPYTLTYSLFAGGSSDEFIDLLLLSTTHTEIAVDNYQCQYPIRQGNISWPVSRLGITTYIGPSPNPIVTKKEYIGQSGDFAQVQITKVQNGYVDGNFSASATLIGGTEKLTITEGIFKNVKIN